MPDYEAALCHSHSIGPVKENIEPSDLHARLLRLVDERLQTAVMHCCTYELPRKPCKGDFTSTAFSASTLETYMEASGNQELIDEVSVLSISCTSLKKHVLLASSRSARRTREAGKI